MDRWRVSMQVLSLPHVYEYYDRGNRAVGVELCRGANDEYARNLRARLRAVSGCLPRFRFPMSSGVQGARTTRKPCPDSPVFTLSTNIHERTLDDPEFAPFFDHANASGLVMFLHPLQRAFPKEWNGYRLEHLIGLPVDTTFALSRLALGGFFDRYPNIKIIAAHVGGAMPFLAPQHRARISRGQKPAQTESLLWQTFYDTSGPTHEAILACVAKMFGTEQIVFGTDYPFGLGQEGKQYVEHAVGVVQDSGLSE